MGIQLVYFLAGLITLAGCTSAPEPDYDFVQKQWTESIKRLGAEIDPVYPPTEDIQLGDVYAIENGPTSSNKIDKTRLRALRLGYIQEINTELTNYYGNRLQLPKTVFSTDRSKVDQSADQGVEKGSAFGGRFVERIPISAFPEYTLASGRVFDFAASLPGKVFGLLFGYVGGQSTDLKVSVSDNSTVGIPAYDAQILLAKFCSRGDQPCSAGRVKEAYRATYGVYPSQAINIRLVSRVHLTRTINFAYTFREASAAKAVAARLGAMQTFADKAAALVTPPETAASTQKTAAAEGADSARNVLLKQMIDSLNQDIKALAGTSGGAFAISSGSYNGRSVVLSQSFTRPLTFAYGGVWWNDQINVDGSTKTAGPIGVRGTVTPLKLSTKLE